jgi:hypothetical protein
MNTISSPASLGPQSQGVIRQPAGLSIPREINATANQSSAETREVDSAKEPRSSNAATEPYTPEEQQKITELAMRDREVRAHEAAHASVGGIYAGAPSYSFARGPDGKNYAVSGEVSIDVSPVAGNPQATIDKAQIVRRAALAPAQPSSQDRAVASAALEQSARQELQMQNNSQEASPANSESKLAIFTNVAQAPPSEPGSVVNELV